MIDKARAPVSKQLGDEAEARALAHLQDQGLRLVERNYRVARGPSARGGEIDLILRDRDGTLVFCEVRARRGAAQGGAAASIGAVKQQRIVFAKIFVPSDANDDSDDTVVISSLKGFLPANPDEPIVRVVSDRENPKFETFLFSKSATDGISLQVPQQDPLGKGRYVSIARFGAAL